MKIFLIGAGYVGQAFLEKMRGQHHELYVSTTDREKVALLKPLAERVFFLREGFGRDVEETIAKCDAIVVLVAPKEGVSYESTYLKTAKELQSALQYASATPYVLYTSSTSVYEGANNSRSASEDDLLSPMSSNSRILVAAEQVYQSIPNHCILRLGGIYGPERELAKRAGRFGGKVMPGTGKEPTNHIHRDDIVSAIDYCLKHRLKGVYNLVSDAHPSREELYGQLCSKLGFEAPVWNGTPYSAYMVSNEKIKEAGFTIEHQTLV